LLRRPAGGAERRQELVGLRSAAQVVDGRILDRMLRRRWAPGALFVVVVGSLSSLAFAQSDAHPKVAHVPRVANMDLGVAYTRLHGAGFRVSFLHSFSAGQFACLPTIASETPHAGQQARKGIVVTLRAQSPSCGVSSPGVPTGKLPSARVPNFADQPVSAGVSWAQSHNLFWQAQLPGLRAGSKTNLLDNYLVATQRPGPGSRLTLGIARGGGNSGSFEPTPLLLAGRMDAARQSSEPYQLYTHCGIRWAKFHGTYWKTSQLLSDGQGNPPAGWGNPFQAGILTFTSPTTAVFKSKAGNVIFTRTARTDPPFVCS